MSDDKTKWEIVNGALDAKNNPSSQKELTSAVSVPPEFIKEGPDGILNKYKQNKITRQASLEMMKSWYSSQLDVAKHQMKKAVDVKKKEVDVDAERFLSEINRKHLEFLRDIEFSNMEGRMEALENLGTQTAEMLTKLQSKDWHASMKDQIINGVMELNQRFFQKIMSE